MAKARSTVALLALSSVLALSIGVSAWQASATVTYEAFMALDVPGRIRTFNEVTSENRADLVRTQIQRWLGANRSRLTADQIAVLEETIAFVTADRYGRLRSQDDMAQQKELENKTAALFTREDIVQALTIRGQYIPRQ